MASGANAEALSNEDLAVEVSDDELVLRATIDRPDQRNALNTTVMSGLYDVLEAADEGPARVVVVRGAGATFCSGGDLTEMAQLIDASPQAYREHLSAISTLMSTMRGTDALTVAAVEGYCLAGGMGVAASADIVIAADDATFGTPEKEIGLFPMQVMAPFMRTVHEKKGLQLLFTGETFDAREAERLGLVSEVVESDGDADDLDGDAGTDDAFDEELDALVDTLVNSSPTMISMGKEAYYHQREMGFEEALGYLREMFALLVMSEDTEAGIEARITGEDPAWRAR